MPKEGHRSLFLILVLFSLVAAVNAFRGYMKFEGIDGSSKAPGHEKWIEILSGPIPAESKTLSFSVPAGTPDAEQLVKAARAGRRFSRVKLDTGKKVYEFEDAAIIWIGKGGSANRPTESLSLNYTKIEYKN